MHEFCVTFISDPTGKSKIIIGLNLLKKAKQNFGVCDNYHVAVVKKHCRFQ